MSATFSRPLLVIAGFPRTGTTSLYHNLSRHPGFVTSARKELNFFCGDEYGSAAAYESKFPGAAKGLVCVDASPFYCLDMRVPERIRAMVPQARVVLILRKPSSWILSAFIQVRSLVPKPLSFGDFLKVPFPLAPQGANGVAMADGMFRNSLEGFARVFADNLLVIDFAAFEEDPLHVLVAIEAFVGAPAHFNMETMDGRAFNSSQLALRYPGWLRRILSREFVARAIAGLMPASLVKTIRRVSDGGGARKPVEDMTHLFSRSELALAEQLMPRDTQLMKEVFSAGPLCSGSEILHRLSS